MMGAQCCMHNVVGEVSTKSRGPDQSSRVPDGTSMEAHLPARSPLPAAKSRRKFSSCVKQQHSARSGGPSRSQSTIRSLRVSSVLCATITFRVQKCVLSPFNPSRNSTYKCQVKNETLALHQSILMYKNDTISISKTSTCAASESGSAPLRARARRACSGAPAAEAAAAMDWEANLAAVIKCADASLEQQFRQFADVAGDLTTFAAPVSSSSKLHGAASTASSKATSGGFGLHFQPLGSIFNDADSDSIGTAYFRESMAAANPLRYDAYREHSGDNDRGTTPPARSASRPTSFAEDFRKRQERRQSSEASFTGRDGRGAAPPTPARFDNNDDDGNNDGQPEFDEEINSAGVRHRQYARRGAQGVAYHMYSSPTYDVAQMMEQVRLSLKLEVDARAAIAERQLSALLNLCKTSTEETDRLRVEVCANDRQIHTLEQVQAKLRQELTTQKDIAFHLQSMCGKDESWRMQAENQLLELRQMVATIREQGNSLHAASQEKLSRAELLVQFNAAMEPIKAQFQANLQHQAQQIAEITRTASSSALLLDALTQKVNRGLADEISELRNELHALKSHVTKMNGMLDISRSPPKQELPPPPPPQVQAPAKDAEQEAAKQRRREQQRSEMTDSIKASVLQVVLDRVDSKTQEMESALELRLSRFAAQQEENSARWQAKLQASSEERLDSLSKSVEDKIRGLQQQIQREIMDTARDAKDGMEQLKQQLLTATSALVESTASASQGRQIDLLKIVEKEQRERKVALEALEESCRKSRHSLEDQIHALGHENRSAAAQFTDKFDVKIRELEKQTANASLSAEKELQARIDSISSTLKTKSEQSTERAATKMREVEDAVSKLEATVSALSAAVAAAAVAAKDSASETKPTKRDEATSVGGSVSEREASTYLGAIETMLQKMQLQLQLQTQAQVQAQLAQTSQLSHPPPYWISSPNYAHSSIAVQPLQVSSPAHVPPTLVQPPAAHTTTVPPAPLRSETPGTVLAAPPPAPAFPPSVAAMPTQAVKSSQHEFMTIDTASIAPAPQFPAEVVSPSTSATTGPVATSTRAETSAGRAPPPPPLVSTAAPAPDPTEKIQQTIAATAKGALAEAEMAKMRVENRRKQETEMRQQQQHAQEQQSRARALTEPSVASQPPSSLSGSSSSTDPQSKATMQQATPLASTPTRAAPPPSASATPAHPHLARASSMSALLPHGAHQAGDKQPHDASTHEEEQDHTLKRRNSVSGGSTIMTSNEAKTNAQSVPEKPVQAQPTVLSITSAPSRVVGSPPAGQTPQLSTGGGAPKPPPPPPPPSLSVPPSTASKSVPTTFTPAPQITGASHVLCTFCRLPIRVDLKSEHERSQCPKRTEECSQCKNKVVASEMDAHSLVCSLRSQVPTLPSQLDQVGSSSGTSSLSATASVEAAASGETGVGAGAATKKCRHCSADVLSQDLFDHELRCDKMLKQCPHCLRRQKVSRAAKLGAWMIRFVFGADAVHFGAVTDGGAPGAHRKLRLPLGFMSKQLWRQVPATRHPEAFGDSMSKQELRWRWCKCS